MNLVDVALLLVVALAAYAEYSRGLLPALADVLRAGVAVGFAVLGYGLTARLTGNPAVGFAVGVALAGGVLWLSAVALKRLGDGSAKRGVLSRLAGSIVGIPFGIAVGFALLAVAAHLAPLAGPADASWLGSRLLDRLPAFYRAADEMNLPLPRFAPEARRFEEERRTGRTGKAERVNFTKFAGSTCIECGARVTFQGYRRLRGSEISPLFVCPDCGRRSDGCQAFESCHEMYGKCPYELAAGGELLDCGVWSNDRSVRPDGQCPVCGRDGY
ncbi:MAG: hypothetical protein R6X14_04040 [bacterium]